MKFTLVINQPQIIKLGITNINQAHIFDLLTTCSTWAKTVVIDNVVYYWVSRNVIVDELPLLNIKADTVYRHLKAIDKAGLILYKKQGVKDLVRITKKGKKYHSDSEIHYVGNKSESPMSEINPNQLGNKSESHSEINPTNQTTNKHQTTKHNEKKKLATTKLDLSIIPENISTDVIEEFIQYRIKKKCALSQASLIRAINQIQKTAQVLNIDCDLVVTETIDAGWQGIGKPEWLRNRLFTKGQNNGSNSNYETPAEQVNRINNEVYCAN